jgi:hypothetical protein
MYFIMAGKTGSASDDNPMQAIATRNAAQCGLT